MGIERKIERDRKFKDQKLKKSKERRQTLEAGRRREEMVGHARRNDLLPPLQIRQLAPSQLIPSPRRTRRESPEQIDRLIASIGEFGFSCPILTCGSEIVDGHVRHIAAQRLGLMEIPTIDVDHLSAGQVRQLRIALNRTAELGEWDLDKLRIEFEELIELDLDLEVTGFTAQEVDIILTDPLTDGACEDEVDDPPGVPVSRLGDLWKLGEHLVICGSALEEDTYDRILSGGAAHVLLCDPPYNVKIKGNVSQKRHGEFVMASGELSDKEFQSFLDTFLKHCAARVVAGGVLFVFMDWRSIHRVYAAGFAAGLTLINCAVWYKQSGAMGSLYRSAHEFVAVFCKGSAPGTNNVKLGRHGRDRQNVWCAPGANRKGSSANAMLGVHATPKPVELCADAILDVTNRGDTVLDAFLGSGTTLIAAEKTGRRCCGIELEPKFVDVAIGRWQELTGEQAVLAESGETFVQVAARRGANAEHPARAA